MANTSRALSSRFHPPVFNSSLTPKPGGLLLTSMRFAPFPYFDSWNEDPCVRVQRCAFVVLWQTSRALASLNRDHIAKPVQTVTHTGRANELRVVKKVGGKICWGTLLSAHKIYIWSGVSFASEDQTRWCFHTKLWNTLKVLGLLNSAQQLKLNGATCIGKYSPEL